MTIDSNTLVNSTEVPILQKNILIIEDEPELVKVLRSYLEKSNFVVEVAYRGDSGLAAWEQYHPDLVLLDLNLPGMDGLDVAREIRRKSDTPIIMITARVEETDQLIGLELGADDYVVKPFSPSELVARVRAVLRRLRPAFEAETIEYGGIAMDLAEYRVTRDGEAIRPAPTEFRLLRHFMEHPGRVFSREQLLDAVWGREIYLEPRTVDVHVRRLRKSLNASGKNDIIRTVRATGYSLDQRA